MTDIDDRSKGQCRRADLKQSPDRGQYMLFELR
jgi:hypothetical protein